MHNNKVKPLSGEHDARGMTTLTDRVLTNLSAEFFNERKSARANLVEVKDETTWSLSYRYRYMITIRTKLYGVPVHTTGIVSYIFHLLRSRS